MKYRSRYLAVPVALAVAFGGCGGESGGDAGADPAALAPANTPFFVEATVRPQGEQKADLEAAAKKLLRVDDPGSRLAQLFDEAVKKGGGKNFSYKDDIEPWLGERAGLFVGNVTGEDADVGVIFASKDSDRAESAIADAAKGESDVKKAKYKDTEYRVDSDKFAAGVLGDYVVVGDEAAFKLAVDAQDGEALGDADRYKKAIDALPDDRVGAFYLDLKSVFDIAAKSDPDISSQLQQLQALVNLSQVQPLAGALLADGEKVALELSMSSQSTKSLGALGGVAGGQSTKLLGELPGDSWGALGLPKVGQSLKGTLSALGAAAGAITGQLEQGLGINLEQDVLSWMGDAAVFVRGADPSSFGAGIVIEATDAGKAKASIGKILQSLSKQGLDIRDADIAGADRAAEVRNAGLPAPIFIALGGGRVVIALGEETAKQALKPDQKLADAPLLTEAGKALDDLPPTFVLSIADALKLVESSGSSDSDFQAVKPYLEALDVIAAGSKVDGDRVTTRIAVGLK